MRVFNQLSLSDEARAGFILLIIFSVVDSCDGRSELFRDLQRWLKFFPSSSSESVHFSAAVALQIVTLITLAALMAIFRFGDARRRLQFEPLAKVDLRFADAVDMLSQKVVGRVVRVVVTPNMTDGNAYCLNSIYGPRIVVGGGLRLLFRKDRDKVLAEIAHELAHIRNQDTGIMLVAWDVVRAYIVIQVARLLYGQFDYWEQVKWSDFFAQHWTLLQIILVQIPNALQRLIPLVSQIILITVLIILIRNREFFADEAAAVYGYRNGITDVLSDHHPRMGTAGSIFHPSTRARSLYVSSPKNWARINFPLVLCIIFITSRTAESLSGLLMPFSASNIPHNENSLVVEALAMRGNWAFWVSNFGSLVVTLLGIGIVAHHGYRVTMSRLALGWSKGSLALAAALSGLACVAGSLVGSITSPAVLWTILHVNRSPPGYISTEMFGMLITGMFAAEIALSTSAVAVMASKFKAGGSGRLFLWIPAIFLGAAILSIPFNFVMYLVGIALGYPNYWELPTLSPELTLLFPIQVSTVLVVILIFGFLGNIASKLHHARDSGSRVHPSRTIEIAG